MLFDKHSIETVHSLIRLICENIEWVNEVIDRIDLHRMKLYFKNGVELTDNDVLFLNNRDVVYLDLLGRDFNQAQMLDQYERQHLLFQNGLYDVYRIVDKGTNKPYILKTISFDEGDKESHLKIEEIWRKLKILQQLDHRNIIK